MRDNFKVAWGFIESAADYLIKNPTHKTLIVSPTKEKGMEYVKQIVELVERELPFKEIPDEGYVAQLEAGGGLAIHSIVDKTKEECDKFEERRTQEAMAKRKMFDEFFYGDFDKL